MVYLQLLRLPPAYSLACATPRASLGGEVSLSARGLDSRHGSWLFLEQ